MAASTGMPPSVDGLIHMLVAARAEMSQLRTQLENQAIIGQAQGIVMERLAMGAPQALAYLARVAEYSRVDLREVAVDTVLTRELPGISSERLRPSAVPEARGARQPRGCDAGGDLD